MKLSRHIITFSMILLFPVAALSGVVKEPPGGLQTNTPPNVLIILDNSGSMGCPAYFTKANGTLIDCNGSPSTSSSNHDDGYVTGNSYYGYFDPQSQYSYASNKFTIDATGEWSGNFLNWLTMRRIDVAKKVLVGGKALPTARQPDAIPNSLTGDPDTGYDYVKKYNNASGVAAGLFPSCGTAADCYFGVAGGSFVLSQNSSNPFSMATGGGGAGGAVTIGTNCVNGQYDGNKGNRDVCSTNQEDAGLCTQCSSNDASAGLCTQCTRDDYCAGACDPYSAPPVPPDNTPPTQYTISIAVTTEWSSGVVQRVSGNVRLGLEFFNGGNGGYIDQYMDGPPGNISYINSIENMVSNSMTPLAESLHTAAGYFGTDPTTGNTGPRYDNAPAKSYNTSGANSDPYDYPGQNDVSCSKTFVVMITDGVPSSDGSLPDTIGDFDNDGDSNLLDDVALWARTTDLRPTGGGTRELAGNQNIILYTVFAFGKAPDELKDAAVNGGFIDKNSNNRPDPPHPSSWANYTGSFTKNEWDNNADGIPDNFFEAESGEGLKLSLLSAFQSILAQSNIATSPVVMPGSNVGDGNYLYASSFLPDMEHQWVGHLRKFPLDSDGFIQGTAPNYVTSWDAGEILGDTCSGTCISSSARNIFTVYSSRLTFNTTNWSALMTPLGVADQASTEKLINFVRGVDVFDEDADGNFTEDRWKLSDIFHSRPIEAGAPPYYYNENNYLSGFKTPKLSRTPVIYAGGNDGMLHAFDRTTGAELWAFIPPMILGDLKSMISASPNKSISQYLVDGTPIVEDIFVGGTWKTILISGLRWGGRGYFALDITDPATPLFMWAVTTDGSAVTYWNSTGTISDLTSDTNYSAYLKLGYSWPEPSTGRIKVDASDKWITVVGGGYRAIKPDVDFDLPNHATGVGRQIYAINLETGAIVGRINETVITDEANDGIDNSIPSSIAIVGDENRYMQYLYTGDREGQLWKANISGSNKGSGETVVADWEACKLFDGEATHADPTTNPANSGNNRRYITSPPEIAMDSDGKRWIAWGTGNGRKVRELFPKVSTPPTVGEGNIFVALKETDPNPVPGTACGTTYTTADLTNVTDDLVGMPSDGNGWYIQLAENEKVFTTPLMYKNILMFTSFIPTSNDICDIGSSYLYLIDYTDGSAVNGDLNGVNITKKRHKLGSGIATAPVVRGDVIQIGITGDATAVDHATIQALGGQRKDPIITLRAPNQADGPPSVQMIMWKEL